MQRRLFGSRLWLARIALATVVPLVLLVATEAGLRLSGAGYPTTFWLRRSKGQVYTDNDKFLWQFYSRKTNLRPIPFAVPIHKPEGSVRIVVLGESAAAGTPEAAYSFGRMLERMLRAQCPGQQIEVINAAMRGANSHIILPTCKDCIRFSPDLFIVYMGNNEAVGLHAPGPDSGRLTPHLMLLRTVQYVRSMRVGELFEGLLQKINNEAADNKRQDDAFFQSHRVAADDPRRAAVYRNFRRNVADICRTARQAGAAVALATVPSNLKDCPPFGSLHRVGLSDVEKSRWQTEFDQGIQLAGAGEHASALAHFSAAEALDGHFAEVHFRLGLCYYALGQYERARQEFVLARDWDGLQFRTDSRLNQLIQQTCAAAHDPAVLLVDVEQAFAESELSAHGLPGERLFYDHVHPTFDGDYLIARTLLPAVSSALTAQLKPGMAPARVLSRDECAQRLAFTLVNEAQIAAAMVQLMSAPPFTGQLDHSARWSAAERKVREQFGSLSETDVNTAFASYNTALQTEPGDWQLAYNFGRLLLLSRAYDRAIYWFEAARRALPYSIPIRLGLSSTLHKAGRYEEALRELHEVLKLDPDSQEARAGVATVERSAQNDDRTVR